MKKVMKFAIIIFSIIIINILVTSCGEEKVILNIYNWGDYIEPSVIKDFEKEYNVKVNYTTFATNEEMYVKLKSGGTSYDVAFPSDYMIEKMIKEDMLFKIDISQMPNYEYIDEKFKNLDYDPKNEYSVPYMWGTFGIVYNKKMVKEPVDSWDILWEEEYKDQILMLDSQRDSIAVALKKLGYSMNSRNKKELEEAKIELLKQKPLVLAYVGDEVKDIMVGEEAALAVVWSGDAVAMMEENENLEYVIPKEGGNLWFDSMIIPTTSKHPKEAQAFIDFMCRPDVALRNTEYIEYSTPNKGAFKELPDDWQNNRVAYPPDKELSNCEIFNDPGVFVIEYDRIWTDIIAE
jgi:spermidine/putrescine transport system substrate-binding protein